MPILPDILDHNLHVVFCGTAPSHVSARHGAYYANPGNKFWPTLINTGLVPVGFRAADYAGVNAHRIGLTDLAKQAKGCDHDLVANDFDRDALKHKIEKYQPRILAFTSKNGGQIFLERAVPDYGKQPEMIGNTLVYVLPSTSGLATRWWSIAPWQELAHDIRQS